MCHLAVNLFTLIIGFVVLVMVGLTGWGKGDD
jgi:hypothetical protein